VELSRVHIPMKAGVEGSDYINASFLQVCLLCSMCIARSMSTANCSFLFNGIFLEWHQCNAAIFEGWRFMCKNFGPWIQNKLMMSVCQLFILLCWWYRWMLFWRLVALNLVIHFVFYANNFASW